jgi:hypothetical protein
MNPHWVVLGLSDLQEAELIHGSNSVLTSFAQVVVWSHCALVSDSSDRSDITAIADDSVVNDLTLLLFLIRQMLDHHALILLSAILVHFRLQNLVKFFEEFVVQFASCVALLARQALLVYFLPVALEALRQVFVIVTVRARH